MSFLQHDFMIRALLAGVLISFLGSFFGAFVVQRGLSFLGSGLAHAAFGGVALGVMLQTEPLWMALPFTVLVAVGIIWLRQRTDLSADTSIGIFFSVSMALGVIFLSRTTQYTTDAITYLFGDILAVTKANLVATTLVAIAALAALPLWGKWAYATFDPELAQADGLPVRRHDYFLSIWLAVTIVVSINLVGITLVAAFLVIPSAAARLVARTFSAMTLISLGISIASVLGGVVASWYLDLPTGPAIILAQTALFTAAMAVKRT